MKARVLLVDDDAAILDGLRRSFRKEPFEISSVQSGKKALELIQTMDIDVLITDEEMPGMSGLELLRILRQCYPAVISIMLTGKPSIEVAQQAINQGEIYRFFTKPCNPSEVAYAIKEALQQRQLIIQCRKLIDAMRQQSQYIRALEHEHPGITFVERDTTGTIIAPSESSLDQVLKEVTEELQRAEKRLTNR